MTIENLILDGTVQTLYSDNKTIPEKTIFRGKITIVFPELK